MVLRLELDHDSLAKLLISNLDINEDNLFKSIFKYKDLAHFVRPSLMFLAIIDSDKKIQLEFIKQNVTLVDIEDTYK